MSGCGLSFLARSALLGLSALPAWPLAHSALASPPGQQTASPSGLAAPDSAPAATASVPGLRPARTGEVVLPATGLRVRVPREDRATTEVFGRFVPAPAGIPDARPEVGDLVSVNVSEAGLAPGGLALSIAFDSQGCGSFALLEGVVRGVSPCDLLPSSTSRDPQAAGGAPPPGSTPSRRCRARSRWDRLDQGLLGEGVPGGATDEPLRGTVWCSGGLVVQAVQRPEDSLDGRRLAAWLEALALSLVSPAEANPPARPILVDAGEGAETRLLPVRQRFYLLAARRELATEAPVHRVETMPGARLCAEAPEGEGLTDGEETGPSAPTQAGLDGAIAVADCFALLMPATLGVSLRVAASPGTCPPYPGRPTGWPRSASWGPRPDGPQVIPTSWRPDALDLCLPLPGEVALRLAVRSEVPLPPHPAAPNPGSELGRPALWLRALGPFLRDLAGARR